MRVTRQTCYNDNINEEEIRNNEEEIKNSMHVKSFSS